MTNRKTSPAKGTTLTGIDIRKALIAANLRPSHFDEKAIWDHCNHWGINDPDSVPKIADDFRA